MNRIIIFQLGLYGTQPDMKKKISYMQKKFKIT
jgi:hypothetical protein